MTPRPASGGRLGAPAGIPRDRWSRLGARAGWLGALAALLVLLLPAMAAAKGTLSVRADKKAIEFGDTVTLTVRATVDDSAGGQPELAVGDLDAWNLVGQSQQTRIDGFRGTRSTTLTLDLQPKRTGSIVIPPFTLKLPDGDVKSQPIVVVVADGGVAEPNTRATPPQTGSGAPDGTPGVEGPPDEVVFLRWEVDRDTVWLGQQIDARLYVYIREGIGLRDFKLGEIDLAGFWNERHDQSRRRRSSTAQIGGLRFERQELTHYTLFPLRAGSPALPGVSADMVVRRMRAFGGPRSRVERFAAEVPITVKALPTAGRPAGFAGPAVGQVKLTASLDQRRIDASQGVTLTVVTRVDGLVQNVPAIDLPTLPDFKVFPAGDDTRSDRRGGKMSGVRRQTWLLRPNRGGRLKLPQLEIPYFDPAAGRYSVARSPTLTVQVDGEPGVEAAAEQPTDRGPALRDIRAEVDPAVEADVGLGAWFWGVLFGAPLLFGLGWGAERFRARRDATAGSRAARTAARDARIALERIAHHTDDARAGYSAVARAIVDYLETRFDAPFNGLTRDAMAAALGARGVGAPTIDALLEELDACDFARFAPAADAASGLASAAKRAADAVDAVEREVGR